MNTFTKFSSAYCGTRLSPDKTINFWQKCSFHNYVQTPPKETWNSPTIDEFNNSHEAFEATIKILKLDLVVVWGYWLWDNLPKLQFRVSIINGTKIHFLNHNYKLIIIIIINPSSYMFNFTLTSYIANYMTYSKIVKDNMIIVQ